MILVEIQMLQARMKRHAEKNLESRLKVAMRESQVCDWVRDEDDRFRVAVGAVLLDANDEERELINNELRFLQALSAAVGGIPVDMGRVLNNFDSDKAIGLRALWVEASQSLIKS